MKHNIKLTTLTPIHIGDGVQMVVGGEVLTKNVLNENIIYIIDPSKVIKFLHGDSQLIDKWVKSVESNCFPEFIENCLKGIDYLELAKRTILNKAVKWLDKSHPLNTFIHDGMGCVYIPGSSLKGAIRTAITAIVLSSEINKSINYNRAKYLLNSKFRRSNEAVNEDVWRFIQVGDAYFQGGCEEAIALSLLNMRECAELLDEGKMKVLEVVPRGQESTLSLKIDLEKYKISVGKVGNMPSCMADICSLFKSINTHTQLTVDGELDYWKRASQYYRGCESYIANLESIKSICEQCGLSSASCVIRVGQGIGWTFTTGAWMINDDNDDIFYKEYVPKIRPNNRYYLEYDFPKSRRVIDGDSELMGFVMLELVD